MHAAAKPNGPDCMNHEFGRERKPGREPRFSDRAPFKPCAGHDEVSARLTVYCAVHAASTKERTVGGIYDRINGEFGDVTKHNRHGLVFVVGNGDFSLSHCEDAS